MAGRVAAFDWSATELGPIGSWPQALRIAVGICLNSRFPMFVWWGARLINIYNDGYIPMLGKRHPEALGRPARDSWSEIWDVVGPQARAVMERGEATWNERVPLVMERHGYVEEAWFTWSYSPIPDGEGGIGGLFCAVTEETNRVHAERERDQLLERVENERARLAEAFAQSPAFLAVLRGPDHVFESINQRYHLLVGKRGVLGRALKAALPEVVEQGFIEILDRVYATGEPFVGNGVRIQLARGPGGPLREYFLDFVYQPLREAGGAVAGILVHGIDATDRHVAEARDRFLIGLEDALRPLSDPAAISAASARLLGEHLQADRCAYAEVQEDQDTFDLVGDHNRGVPSIVGRYRFADFGAEVLALMRAGKPYVVSDVDSHEPPIGDLTFYRQTLIQAVICVPLLKSGRFVAAIAVHQKVPRQWSAAQIDLVLNVASRIYESLERARVERSLRQSEASFRELADAMPQIVFAANEQGRVDYLNRQWFEYTGLPEGDTGTEAWREVLTGEGLARALEAWPEALRTGTAYEIEHPLRRRDGEMRWHLGRALPIRDAEGSIVRWFGTHTDIHDRKQIEDALNRSLKAERQARGEAELASRMKDEFLATLSHELRTPLNAILGWAHMIRRDGMTEAQLAHGADVIERNARAQSRIIDDLLDMSAIVSGKVRLELSAERIDALVRSALDAARPVAEAKGIELAACLPEHPVVLHVDSNRLQQVLSNLLTNALKFTPRGGRIGIAVAANDEFVEVSVADSGEGIAPEFLPYVFDRFRQADASTTRQHGGLGLGLSIVRQLVELHGGQVEARSAGQGQGATFLLSLPRSTGAMNEENLERRRAGAARVELPADECERIARMNILVVDDEADARDLVSHLLQDRGARVTTAPGAEQALALLAQGRFDLLVSDIGMPGEDGYELIRRVRALAPEAGGAMPAIALTAYARPEDRVKAIRAGFQMHAAKPVEPAELLAMVASLARR